MLGDQRIDNIFHGVLQWNFHRSLFLRVLFHNGRGWGRKNQSRCPLWFFIITKRKCSGSKIKEWKQATISSQKWITYESASRKSIRVGGGSLEVDWSCGTSFVLDEPKEVKSSRCFLFLSAPWSSDSAGGGDRVESIPSREPSAPSPS
jgi:hypothetical protein